MYVALKSHGNDAARLTGWCCYGICFECTPRACVTLQSSLFREIRGRAKGLYWSVVATLAEMQAMVARLYLVGNLDVICYLPNLKTR